MNIQEKLLHIQTLVKAPKSLYNKFGGYNYRNAEGILEAVKPYLDEVKCTLTISDEIVTVGGRIYVKANATLWDAEALDVIAVSAYAREAETKKGMDDSQITGTASSYARKYALNGLLLLDDTKDADTDEYARQTGADKKAKETKPTGPSMAEEIRSLAKEANVPEGTICTQAGLEKLEDLTDTQLYARLKTALMAKINITRANDGAAS